MSTDDETRSQIAEILGDTRPARNHQGPEAPATEDLSHLPPPPAAAPDRPPEPVRAVSPFAPEAPGPASPAPNPSGHGQDLGAAYTARQVTDHTGPVSWSQLDLEVLRPREKPRATRGWRGRVRRMTGGLVSPELSAEEQEIERAKHLIRTTPLGGQRRIAVMSEKGGVGKTTTSTLLASVLAELRPSDPVLAVDTNSDSGTLALRAGHPNGLSVRELLDNEADIRRLSDFQRYCSIGENGVTVLASSEDPTIAESFTAEEYQRMCRIAERFFPIVVADCGTGITHDATRGVMASATELIIPMQPAIDSAMSAALTMQKLVNAGHQELVGRGTAVVTNAGANRGGEEIDVAKVMSQLGDRMRRWVVVPHDGAVAIGGRIDVAKVGTPTMDAMTMLAAHVVEDFLAPPLASWSDPPESVGDDHAGS